MNGAKFASGKYLRNVLKNRSNKICTNEICIRQESPLVRSNSLWIRTRKTAWRLVESYKGITYVCPKIANLKTQLALLSKLKVKLGCIIRTKRANFFLAYSSTFVTHVVTLLTAIVYKQVQGHIVVLDSLIAHVCVSIGKHKSDLYFGPDFFLLSFFGVGFENIHYVRPV